MAFDIGVNFRATAGYVTDPANTRYCLDEAYPVTRGGATFGWTTTTTGTKGRDRNSAIDPRLAGISYRTDTTFKDAFRIDLPSAGVVDIYAAMGDVGNNAYLEIFDDTTSLGILTPAHVSMASGVFYDAANNLWSAANWPGSNVKATLTFATTKLIAKITPGTNTTQNYAINHIRAVQVDAGSPVFGNVNVGGTWKTVNGISVNVGGVWKAVSEAKVNVGGAWKSLT